MSSTIAIDFSGDGKSDIWNNVPDVLASTGNYLHKGHWKYRLPWGFEVSVPAGFDYMKSHASFEEWEKARRSSRRRQIVSAVRLRDPVFPGGGNGPAFIVTENYAVLKEYNNSDAYAIAVGHLADRMQGAPPFKAAGRPTITRCRATRASRLQKKLAALGYKVIDFEGHVDFDLRDNIRAEQKKFGMMPDGNPTPAFLRKARPDMK